jgi:uncharacterized membrane protein
MHAVQWVLLISQAGACVAIIARGLFPRFRVLVAYLACSMLRGFVLAQYPPNDGRYLDIWLVTNPLVSALQVAVALEAYGRSLTELPGAQRLTHWGIIGISVLAAAMVQIPQKTYTPNGVLSLAHQAVTMVLGLAAVLLAALLSYLRPQRRPNAIWHERILTIHFLASAVTLAMVHVGQLTWPSVAHALISTGCCAAWAILLTKQGEELPDQPALVDGSTQSLESFRDRLTAVLRGS